jgi:toxin ParE1/3/4
MPKKRVEYRLAPAALRDLEGIWLYTLEQWGIEQAHRYVDEVTAAFDKLANNPQHGMPSEAIRKGYRRSGVGRHMIYFRITDYGIAIIRVLHARMDAPRYI